MRRRVVALLTPALFWTILAGIGLGVTGCACGPLDPPSNCIWDTGPSRGPGSPPLDTVPDPSPGGISGANGMSHEELLHLWRGRSLGSF